MTGALRAACRRLLEEGAVQVVIGYGERGQPVLATRRDDVDRLFWNGRCIANLAVYLTRKEVKALGAAAIVVKGCDERALVALEKEGQIDRRALHVIGMACDGFGDARCANCTVRTPRFANETIGEPRLEPVAQPVDALAEFMQRTPAGRWEFWRAELARCVKCYACRQVCPLCYCERCVADKNRPVRIETSASPRGNFAWHVTRAFHHAGRCVGCGECVRACPAGIDLALLNESVSRAVAEEFGYTAGADPAAEPAFGAWAPGDKEDFIR
jgi:formate dehydrogenase subunit beta